MENSESKTNKNVSTERLNFKNLEPIHREIMFQFNSNIELLKYIPRTPFTEIKQADEKINNMLEAQEKEEAIWWVFYLKSTNEIIGYGGLFEIDNNVKKAEMGYGIFKEYWGKGYASEFTKKMVEFGFEELKLNKIYGIITPGNTASEKALMKLGFEKEAHLKDNTFERNEYFDSMIYSLFKRNWK